MIPLVGWAKLQWADTDRRRPVFVVMEKNGGVGTAQVVSGERKGETVPFAFSDASEFSVGEYLPSESLMLSRELGHLEVGDIVALDPKASRARILFLARAQHHSFLVTEQCDNFCVMCSQPPRKVDDKWLLEEILEIIPWLPKGTREIGFTGGEPTLLGDDFLEAIKLCKEFLPHSAVHVLSNGRRFSDIKFTESWANLNHSDLMVGIPIYSDLSNVHDFVVQADGAFDETIRGILNLKRLKQRVEVRLVLHKHTMPRLQEFAYFIARNLRFVDQVALMGLELMGFAKAKPADLWIRLSDFKEELREAVMTLSSAGIRTLLFNTPLCVLDSSIWPYAVKSISDWKREYAPECSSCRLLPDCGGAFFSSRAMLLPELRPIQ